MGRVEGKVALITGAARGQGAAHAGLLARHGARVVIADIRDGEGEALAGRLGAHAEYLHHDVAAEDSWQAVAETIRGRHGRLDVLVNNAAVAAYAKIADTDAALFERLCRINLLGTFLGIKYGAALMRAAGGGSIVNISSMLGLKAGPQFSAYASTKWGVRGLTRSAAIELAPDRIRVNTICPGIIDTPMLPEAVPGLDVQSFGESHTPLGRIGLPQDIASAVLFLASDESSFVTGAELAVDGGATA